MAKYQLTQPAFIDGKYYEADARNPASIELPDDVEPSSTFEPLDEAGKAALERLDQARLDKAEAARAAALNPKPVVAPVPKPPKREIVADVTASDVEGATSDTHQRPAPPSVPGTKEQRPQDWGTKDDAAAAPQTSSKAKRVADKDQL